MCNLFVIGFIGVALFVVSILLLFISYVVADFTGCFVVFDDVIGEVLFFYTIFVVVIVIGVGFVLIFNVFFVFVFVLI